MKSKLTGPKTSIILNGLKEGKTEAEIARDCSVHQSSISRFLAKIKPHFADLETLTASRGDIFNLAHGKSMAILNQCLDAIQKIMDEENGKDPQKRITVDKLLAIMRGVGVNQAIVYDKLRLEGGLSTENHGLVGHITHAHKMVSPFDAKTGEFKASLVQPIEKNQSKHVDSLKLGQRNVLTLEETRMNSGDNGKTSDKSN